MFHCPRCGTIEKSKDDIYAHFESDPPCPVRIINVTYDQIRSSYDIYCETFEEMVAQENGYKRDGLPIRVILEMVTNLKTFIIIQDRETQLNHAEFLWALDIAFSSSCRKIYDNYDAVMARVVPPETEVKDPREDLEVVPEVQGGYPEPPPATPGWIGPLPIPDEVLAKMNGTESKAEVEAATEVPVEAATEVPVEAE